MNLLNVLSSFEESKREAFENCHQLEFLLETNNTIILNINDANLMVYKDEFNNEIKTKRITNKGV